MLITIIIISFAVMILITLLDLSSTTQITNSNIEFIKDIYESCTDYYKVKIQQLIDWHKAYHHPFIVERSYKVHIPTNKINNNRFAVFIDLDSFLTRDGYIIEKKWLEFSTIIKMPIQIEKKCINHMIKREEQVDFIWGLDPLEEKEKIYLEFPSKGLIESYVINDTHIAERYEYIKKKTSSPRFMFMYTRTSSDGHKDSFHYVLTEPVIKDDKTIYIISYSPSSETQTYYYRYK